MFVIYEFGCGFHVSNAHKSLTAKCLDDGHILRWKPPEITFAKLSYPTGHDQQSLLQLYLFLFCFVFCVLFGQNGFE